MSDNKTGRPLRNLVQRAAGTGLVMGVYLTVMAVLTGIMQSVPVASIVVWAMTLGTPVVLYFLLRRSYAEADFRAPFSEMWTEGIAVFFLGAAIQGVVIYLGLRYLVPDYIADSMNTTLEVLSGQNTEAAAQLAANLQRLKEMNVLPSAADVTAQIMSMNIILGAFLSLIDCSVLFSRYRSETRRERYRRSIQNKEQ